MSVYKDFIYCIRKIDIEVPHLIIINENPPEQLKTYIKKILELPFEDQSRHVYHGELKLAMTSFLNFYTDCIYHAYKNAEHYSQHSDFPTAMELYEATIKYHEKNRQTFLKEFQPIDCEEDKQKFDTIESEYQLLMEKLKKIGDYLLLMKNKPSGIDKFAKEHFHICVEQTSKMCSFTQEFIAKMLADRIPYIRRSIEDVWHRMWNNLRQFQGNYENQTKQFYDELYELQKEKVVFHRNMRLSKNKAALIDHKIDIMRKNLQKFGNQESFDRIYEENEFWVRKLEEFEKIVTPITNLKNELDKSYKEEKIFVKFETTEPPGSKATGWTNIGENLAENTKDLEKKYTEACKVLLTFFKCRGIDCAMDKGNIGWFFEDAWGHETYLSNYGAERYHVNCEGELVQIVDTEKYYIDEYGRYVIQNGEKLYQVAPCTNYHSRKENGQLQRIDSCNCCKKCGKQLLGKSCITDLVHLMDVELLPKTEPVNIENTLDAETVKYLWDTFGWILPEVLDDLAKQRPKNPIHYFGHILLRKSYEITKKEKEEKQKEAARYHKEVLDKRKKEAAAKTLAWKLKLAQPCKPEDLDSQDAGFSGNQDAQFVADVTRYY